MLYEKVLCVDVSPETEDYYLTDKGEAYYYFPDDVKTGWCTNEARPFSEEYPIYWMKPVDKPRHVPPPENLGTQYV